MLRLTVNRVCLVADRLASPPPECSGVGRARRRNQMLDIYGRDAAQGGKPVVQNAEFFRIELSPTDGGSVFVSMTATTVDDVEPQLLDQEIISERIATL